MKKSLLLACFLSVCTVSGFAQSTANEAGAKLVAERDAAYAQAHPDAMKSTMPAARHTKQRHGKQHRAATRKAMK